MSLVDINANFGRHGLNKQGWEMFTRNLDRRLQMLEDKNQEAMDICKITQTEFNTYVKVYKEKLKHGCTPVQELRDEVDNDTTWVIAITALILSGGHLVLVTVLHIASWFSAFFKGGG